MAKAPRSKMYRVELFVEVPNSLSAPTEWNWDLLVNGSRADTNKTPVTFVLAHESLVGKS